MKTPPTISFIVISYNEPMRLVICLESLRRQIYPFYEIVVSDDGTDGTIVQEICEHYAAKFVTRTHDSRDGLPLRNIPAVANQSVPLASGELLCFLQQDHIVQPDYGLWLARTHGRDDIMFGLMDRRDDVCIADLDAMLRNLHLPEEQTRYNLFMDQGRTLCRTFDDWRLTDGFDFALRHDQWVDMDTRFMGASHAVLDAMLQYRINGLRYVLNPLMRVWHWEHEGRDAEGWKDQIDHSYKQMEEKWGPNVWLSIVNPILYSFNEERRAMQERYGLLGNS